MSDQVELYTDIPKYDTGACEGLVVRTSVGDYRLVPGESRVCIECELITLCTYEDALCKPYVTDNGVQWLQPERVGGSLEVL